VTTTGVSPEVLDAIRDAFDTRFYLSHNPDVAEAGVDALEHYCRFGWKERRDPAPFFSTSNYLEAYPDVAKAGVNPFWHYLSAGIKEGRSAEPSHPLASTRRSPVEIERDRHMLDVVRNGFDPAFYRALYPDVAQGGWDAVEHYCSMGWREGRDPAPFFSTSYYLEANPDVAMAAVNPFWHFLVTGRAEGRMPRHPGGHSAEILRELKPLEETVSAWRKRERTPEMLDAGALIDAILGAGGGEIESLVVSISHDDYRAIPGGVQNCIHHEEAIASESGFLYLNMHPHQPLPRLAHTSEDRDPAVDLVLSGVSVGTAPSSEVASAVRSLSRTSSKIYVVIHHLLGHSPERVTELVHATGRKECWLWLHDFFTVCPSFALQRNDVRFCGAPPVASNACKLCVYGKERSNHLDRLRALVDSVDVHALAPSEFMLHFWQTLSDMPVKSVTALPHMTIEWTAAKKPVRCAAVEGEPITIAFVGHPAAHKGWPVFSDLAREVRNREHEIALVYFGVAGVGLDGVEYIPLQVTRDDPDAMIRAIATREVDFVLHWASWPETFSFSTFEALAAGAYVLTNEGSGNVATTVRKTQRGLVLSDTDDLSRSLEDGRLQEKARELRSLRTSKSVHVRRSKMTFSALWRETGA